jgi:hypothetical protein
MCPCRTDLGGRKQDMHGLQSDPLYVCTANTKRCTSPHPNASRKVKKTPLNAQQMITPSRQCKHPVLESPAAFADSRAAPTDRELLLGHVGMLSRPFLDIEAQRTPTHARFFCDLAICQIAVFA